MVEEVLPGIFRIEVPLRHNPLESVNAYLIKGRKRNLVVDTGLDRDECAKVLQVAFRKLAVNPENTDFFITHLHVDHLELVFKVASPNSRVFFNSADFSIFDDDSWEDELSFASAHGFPPKELQKMFNGFSRTVFNAKDKVKFTFLRDGEVIDMGNRLFQCLETPGHTPGSMCLYEAGERILFSGDHILEKITPGIVLFREKEMNPLQSYLESLDKIAGLRVDLVLPGHRKVFGNLHRRIEELINHHRKRGEEILTVLNEEDADAFQLASRISWDLPLAWHEFPTLQKWFATGETLAHLKYLENRKLVVRYETAGKTKFICANT